ncbi:SET and MYND domain-containing protein DDB_G0273589-like [Aphidius gifuensis]|uniref:SET and MYND domain-containing protein DDB_G0273589-like n=1 Tax=Aphidius gifuensis TaxID=684658 RepID=UPI001CDBEEAC|nr:SET and MYND domain-containing protein DDB_G0273589-like [Aphidius gifuensis]
MIQINCEKLFDDRSGGLLRSNRKSFIDKLTAIIESMPAMSIEERVNFILNDLSSEESTNKLVDLPPANPKSAEVSLAHREAGNKYFTSQGKRNIDKAFEEYTKSMAFAPIKSREYSLACANRSAVLFECNWFEDCLTDINHALENNYPDNLKAKLYLRKACCLQVLKPDESIEIKQAFADVKKWINKMDKKIQEDIENKLKNHEFSKQIKIGKCCKLIDDVEPKLNGENSLVPGLSSALDLNYTQRFGRHIIANRDIKPGEILGVQKPYVNVVDLRIKYRLCWHCTKQTWASIPCDNCSDVIFCSKNCLDQAMLQYHDIECKIFNEICVFTASELTPVVLRLAIKAFKESKNSLDKLKNYLHGIDCSKNSLTKGFTNGKLDPDKFSSAYGLSLYQSDVVDTFRKVHEIYNSIVSSYFFCKDILGFTGSLSVLKDDPRFLFLVVLMEKCASFTMLNSFGIQLKNCSTLSTDESVKISGALLPAFSFFNNSCVQMMSTTFHNESYVCRSLRPIKKGEQIFLTYRYSFSEESKQDRQNRLMRLYNFVCDCEACTNDWTLKSDDLSSLPPSKFIDVKTKMKQLESLKEKIKKIDEITAADWKKTNQFLIRKNIQDQLEKYVAEFYYTYVEYPEAIAYITKFMEQLHKISEKPIFSIDQ